MNDLFERLRARKQRIGMDGIEDAGLVNPDGPEAITEINRLNLKLQIAHKINLKLAAEIGRKDSKNNTDMLKRPWQ